MSNRHSPAVFVVTVSERARIIDTFPIPVEYMDLGSREAVYEQLTERVLEMCPELTGGFRIAGVWPDMETLLDIVAVPVGTDLRIYEHVTEIEGD